MKTILHIAQAPGGVERYLQMLLKYTDKNRFRSVLICSQDYDLEKFRDFADAIEVVKMYRSIEPIKDFGAICQIRRMIRKYRPDYVYMHSSKAGAIGRVANIGMNNKSIYNAHGWAFNMRCSSKAKTVYRLAEKMLAPLCTEIVAISDFEKESALKNRICKQDKIKVIYNGIDFSEYEDSAAVPKEKLGIPQDARVVGTVGRLSDQKAPDVFIKSAAEIKKRIPASFFVMVGDGELREDIEQLIEAEGISDSVLITGWVDNPMDYIRIFDVATLLSRWEGFGLVLAEYMLAGKPIVATQTDAIPNLISSGVNGTLVTVDDYKAAADAVVTLLQSPQLYNGYIAAGVKCVKDRFDVRRVAEETMALLQEIDEKQ